MAYAEIIALVEEKMAQTEALMRAEMQIDVPLAEMVMEYAIGRGGKRFRPLLLLLATKMCSYQGQNDVVAAAFIEFIHSATLLHDDVVDASTMRRGQPSANEVFGNSAAVLVGDFVYTRAFQLMVRVGEAQILQVMVDATNAVAAGEVMQLSNQFDVSVDEVRYYRVIALKTAALFAAACEVAAILAGCNSAQRQALAEYGQQLGMAFQILDDLLDYDGDSAVIGKQTGDDLAEGKPTLALIRAISQLPEEKSVYLQSIIMAGEREKLAEVRELLGETDAIDYARMRAKERAMAAKAALALFPDNEAKMALARLAEMAADRAA